MGKTISTLMKIPWSQPSLLFHTHSQVELSRPRFPDMHFGVLAHVGCSVCRSLPVSLV